MQSPAIALDKAVFIAGLPATMIVRMQGGRGASSIALPPPSIAIGPASPVWPDDPPVAAPPAPPAPVVPDVIPAPAAPALDVVVPRPFAPGGFVMIPSPHATTATVKSAIRPKRRHGSPPPLKQPYFGNGLIPRSLQTALWGILRPP